MAKVGEGSLYQKMIDITWDYLGPASKRFVDRQIQNHLNKRPSDLLFSDMGELLDWIRLAFSLLTNDRAIVDEYIHRLKLAAKTAKKVNGRIV